MVLSPAQVIAERARLKAKDEEKRLKRIKAEIDYLTSMFDEQSILVTRPIVLRFPENEYLPESITAFIETTTEHYSCNIEEGYKMSTYRRFIFKEK